jgi:hypothetical protein
MSATSIVTAAAGRLQQERAGRSRSVQKRQRKNQERHEFPWHLRASRRRVLAGFVIGRRRWLDHRECDKRAQRAERRFGEPAGGEAPDRDDGAARDRQRSEDDDLDGTGARVDALELGFAADRDACAIEQGLVGARAEGVGDRDEQACADEAGNAIGQPAADHAGYLQQRTEDEAAPVSEPVGEPAGWHLQRHQEQIARRHRRGHERRGHLLLLHPPQEIQAVHDTLDGGDLVRQVEPDVSSVAGSVRRSASHGASLSDPLGGEEVVCIAILKSEPSRKARVLRTGADVDA